MVSYIFTEQRILNLMRRTGKPHIRWKGNQFTVYGLAGAAASPYIRAVLYADAMTYRRLSERMRSLSW
jgi:hypothetical protein